MWIPFILLQSAWIVVSVQCHTLLYMVRKSSCRSKVQVCFFSKHHSLVTNSTEMVWKRYKYDSATHNHWNSTWSGLKSTQFKGDGRNQTATFFFQFFWVSFNNEKSTYLTKQFSNWWKQIYLSTSKNEENSWQHCSSCCKN